MLQKKARCNSKLARLQSVGIDHSSDPRRPMTYTRPQTSPRVYPVTPVKTQGILLPELTERGFRRGQVQSLLMRSHSSPICTVCYEHIGAVREPYRPLLALPHLRCISLLFCCCSSAGSCRGIRYLSVALCSLTCPWLSTGNGVARSWAPPRLSPCCQNTLLCRGRPSACTEPCGRHPNHRTRKRRDRRRH